MHKLSDEQLVEELKFRLDQSRKSLHDLSVVNRKLVEMNHKLEESEALKSNFLSNIRNEINNPLNAIIGLASQLAAMVKRPEVSELVTMIFSEAFHLDFQLRNIFIAAELEAGEAMPTIEHVDVTSVVQGVLDNFRTHAADKQVSVRFSVTGAETDNVLYFPTDSQKLQVIIANLVANAVEFSGPGSEVVVQLDQTDKGLMIQVRDQGVGIAEADLKRIFDRFVQLDSGPTRAHLGHGLGLSVVKSLLDLLQGDIQVSSTPEVGSLFTVTLPAAAYGADGVTFAEGGNLFLFGQMDEK
ncbi:HAMP domain-containing histidine kinase [Trichlorobacter lovleyi]|uniref:sensor histidine kinase n=1 Tax=Trichlorobacter lovleyi TaxID=313985 RepID=UPI00223F4E47|nr:HAMP domain-containing sensor histidine kinase [Trichlorobacter lovleyi]QOX78413.1 HAMP domain-containing histidine kinase [Trichlorobacter lovleyi]